MHLIRVIHFIFLCVRTQILEFYPTCMPVKSFFSFVKALMNPYFFFFFKCSSFLFFRAAQFKLFLQDIGLLLCSCINRAAYKKKDKKEDKGYRDYIGGRGSKVFSRYEER